jgi:hypothetical protein
MGLDVARGKSIRGRGAEKCHAEVSAQNVPAGDQVPTCGMPGWYNDLVAGFLAGDS